MRIVYDRFSLCVLTCLGLSIVAGCDAPDGVTWLPDSSGFLFVVNNSERDDGEDLHFFDVASGTRRVLIAKTGTRTMRPAVSADGKLIALARLEEHPHKPASMRI